MIAQKPQKQTPRTPRTLLEKHVQQQIVDYLRLLGATVYVLGTTRRRGDHQGTMQTPGIPDLFVFFPRPRLRGYLGPHDSVWIEVKRQGGKRSPAQEDFALECHTRQVPYICGDLDAVKTWLRNRGSIREA